MKLRTETDVRMIAKSIADLCNDLIICIIKTQDTTCINDFIDQLRGLK